MVKWLEDLGPAVFSACKIRKTGRDSKKAATWRGISVRRCRMALFSYPGIDDTAFDRKIEIANLDPETWKMNGMTRRQFLKSTLKVGAAGNEIRWAKGEECGWVALPSEPVLNASRRATRFSFRWRAYYVEIVWSAITYNLCNAELVERFRNNVAMGRCDLFRWKNC